MGRTDCRRQRIEDVPVRLLSPGAPGYRPIQGGVDDTHLYNISPEILMPHGVGDVTSEGGLGISPAANTFSAGKIMVILGKAK
jgi:hypothetical protein